MNATVRLHPEAELELEVARGWYECQRASLGSEFLLRVNEAIQLVRKTPETFPVVYENARQLIVRKFPYSLIYRLESDALVIYSVLHHRRHPDIWKARLDEPES